MSPKDDGRPVGWIREIVLNARRPAELARFWAALLGGSPTTWYDGWVTLEPPPHGQRLSFQYDPDPAPAGASAHFDVLVTDLERAHERVQRLGGQFHEERWSPRPGPAGEAVPWRVYSDPEGHRFCLVLR